MFSFLKLFLYSWIKDFGERGLNCLLDILRKYVIGFVFFVSLIVILLHMCHIMHVFIGNINIRNCSSLCAFWSTIGTHFKH